MHNDDDDDARCYATRAAAILMHTHLCLIKVAHSKLTGAPPTIRRAMGPVWMQLWGRPLLNGEMLAMHGWNPNGACVQAWLAVPELS